MCGQLSILPKKNVNKEHCCCYINTLCCALLYDTKERCWFSNGNNLSKSLQPVPTGSIYLQNVSITHFTRETTSPKDMNWKSHISALE